VTIRILKTLKSSLKKVTKIASYQFAQVALENELVAYILPVNIHFSFRITKMEIFDFFSSSSSNFFYSLQIIQKEVYFRR
jgi:hypothetical protein